MCVWGTSWVRPLNEHDDAAAELFAGLVPLALIAAVIYVPLHFSIKYWKTVRRGFIADGFDMCGMHFQIFDIQPGTGPMHPSGFASG